MSISVAFLSDEMGRSCNLAVLVQPGVGDWGIFGDKLIEIIYVRIGDTYDDFGCSKIYQAFVATFIRMIES
jgi:hypothetical protein